MSTFNKIKVSIFVVTFLSFFSLLISIGFRDQVTAVRTRSETGFTEVKNVTETEKVQIDAPAGIRKEYTF